MSHATVADLTTWLPTGTVVEDVDRLLERASTKVDRYTRAIVDTGSDTHTTALRDATCAVIEAWLETGEENDLDGLAGTQMSVPGYTGMRALPLPPRAYEALAMAGLTQPVG